GPRYVDPPRAGRPPPRVDVPPRPARRPIPPPDPRRGVRRLRRVPRGEPPVARAGPAVPRPRRVAPRPGPGRGRAALARPARRVCNAHATAGAPFHVWHGLQASR